MKVTLILLMTSLLFLSCNSSKSKSDDDNQFQKESIDADAIDNDILAVSYKDSIPPSEIDGLRALSFKFNVDSLANVLKTIDVYSNNNHIQKIIANKEIESNNFQLIDWNFDGYKDISVLHNYGSGGCSYWIWNYSSKENRYIYNKELSKVLGLEIDTSGKYIVFHYRAGYSEEYWDSLQYKDNKLSFVKGLYRERWNDSLGNSWVKNTYKKMINNVMVTKIDSFITK